MSDSKLHKLKGKVRRGICNKVPAIVNKYFDRKCGSIDGKLNKMEIRGKELKKPIEID